MNHLPRPLIAVLISITMISCDHDVEQTSNNKNLNSFSMILDGNKWTPTVIDRCQKTFTCNMSRLNNSPFYTMEAYKDPSSIASLSSENFFKIQIMDVDEVDVYIINDTFGSLNSYAMFGVNHNNETKVYQNKYKGDSFQVEITEFIPRENSEVLGIKGSFSGTLYNRDNDLDSIQITNGEFIFQKTNWYNFNQCKQ